MIKKKRIEWVDILKGIAIISVFVGHTTNYDYGRISGGIHMWIYSYHMPLFFFLSGYVFSIKKYNNYRTFLISKLKTICVPIIFFSVLTVVFSIIYYSIILGNTEYCFANQIDNIVGIIVQQREGKYNSMFWFLGCLFIVENIFYWIIKFSHMYGTKVIIISSIIMYISGCLYVKIYEYYLPWAIEIAMIVMIFMATGYLIKEKKIDLIYKLPIYYAIPLFIVNIVLSYLNCIVSNNKTVNLYINEIGNIILFPISAFTAIFAFIILFKNVNKIKIFNYIGRNSLIFYGASIITVSVPNIIIYNILKTDFYSLGNIGVLYSVIYSIVQCLVTIPIVEIINKKMKFALGKF